MSDTFQVSGNRTPSPALPLNELVFHVLRDHIVRNVFAKGLVLRQGAIIESFGVGRAPAAEALKNLESEGLIRKRMGHGFIVASDGQHVKDIEMELGSAGLVLPKTFNTSISQRKLKIHIYPEVEQVVASLLVFGRFCINKSALAEFYGVSRTVAHEVLMGLEGVGLARLGSNARWYAGPMTYDLIEEYYEMRWLLEPIALRQAAPSIPHEELRKYSDFLDQVLDHGIFTPSEMGQVEMGLHSDLILRCTNQQMRQTILRCQLPIIATFDTVNRNTNLMATGSGLREATEDHKVVLDHWLKNDIDGAANALEHHLHHVFELCAPHFKNLPPPPLDKVPPYMTLDA